jgi:hypothetical protein
VNYVYDNPAVTYGIARVEPRFDLVMFLRRRFQN